MSGTRRIPSVVPPHFLSKELTDSRYFTLINIVRNPLEVASWLVLDRHGEQINKDELKGSFLLGKIVRKFWL